MGLTFYGGIEDAFLGERPDGDSDYFPGGIGQGYRVTQAQREELTKAIRRHNLTLYVILVVTIVLLSVPIGYKLLILGVEALALLPLLRVLRARTQRVIKEAPLSERILTRAEADQERAKQVSGARLARMLIGGPLIMVGGVLIAWFYQDHRDLWALGFFAIFIGIFVTWYGIRIRRLKRECHAARAGDVGLRSPGRELS